MRCPWDKDALTKSTTTLRTASVRCVPGDCVAPLHGLVLRGREHVQRDHAGAPQVVQAQGGRRAAAYHAASP